MRNANSILKLLPILLVLLATGCTLDEPDSPAGLQAPAGAETFTSYVAIGNSLTAGYMDSGLMIAGQRNSYPMLIATAMGLDTASWMQPYVGKPGLGTTDVGDDHVAGVLHFDGTERLVKRPYMIEDLCIGCGICETKCPVAGKSSIIVTPQSEQRWVD